MHAQTEAALKSSTRQRVAGFRHKSFCSYPVPSMPGDQVAELDILLHFL